MNTRYEHALKARLATAEIISIDWHTTGAMPPKSRKLGDDDVIEVVDAVDKVVDLVGDEEAIPTDAKPDKNKGAKGRGVTFVLDSEEDEEFDDDDDGDDDEDDEDDEEEDDLVASVSQLSQLLVTEDGEAIADILRGILDALDKHNKIMYRGLQVLETSLAKGRR